MKPMAKKEQLLLFGEKLRENPRTFWFSVPIFLICLLVYFLLKDKKALAHTFEQLGIVPQNTYRHWYKNSHLLTMANFLFKKASQLAPEEDKPAYLLKYGQTLSQLGQFRKSLLVFNKALKICKKYNQQPMLGYILSHKGHTLMEYGFEKEAFKDLKESIRLLEQALKEKSFVYHQIWLSGAELSMAEWYLKSKKKHEALKWAKKAEKRAKENNLKIRILDSKKVLEEIKKTF